LRKKYRTFSFNQLKSGKPFLFLTMLEMEASGPLSLGLFDCPLAEGVRLPEHCFKLNII